MKNASSCIDLVALFTARVSGVGCDVNTIVMAKSHADKRILRHPYYTKAVIQRKLFGSLIAKQVYVKN